MVFTFGFKQRMISFQSQPVQKTHIECQLYVRPCPWQPPSFLLLFPGRKIRWLAGPYNPAPEVLSSLSHHHSQKGEEQLFLYIYVKITKSTIIVF